MCVGFTSFGQRAIMSMFAPRFAAALTMLTLSPKAAVTSAAGFASAWSFVRLAVDEAPSGA